jgi:hypothetical protein
MLPDKVFEQCFPVAFERPQTSQDPFSCHHSSALNGEDRVGGLFVHEFLLRERQQARGLRESVDSG